MEGLEITLPQMMECRERRIFIQNELLKNHHKPVISFCMNIPGPIKTNPQIRAAFLTGKKELLDALQKHGYCVFQQADISVPTGDEWIAAVDASAEEIKEITMKIENSHPLGRLFDMDVINTDNVKLSRPQINPASLLCLPLFPFSFSFYFVLFTPVLFNPVLFIPVLLFSQ